MHTPILPVVLAGGSGTRLWPISHPARPKQFLRLVSPYSLFQDTLLRLKSFEGALPPLILSNQAHAGLITEQLTEIHCQSSAILLEPAARSTAPAIAVAALKALQLYPDSHPDPLLLVMPSDHVIQNVPAFLEAVRRGAEAAKAGWLTTFGVVPDSPKTGYGYLEQGEPMAFSGLFQVQRFVEKPAADRAAQFLLSGEHLWNSGIFLFNAGSFLSELEQHQPDVLNACREAVARGHMENGSDHLDEAAFKVSPSISIDYAVMEKTRHAAVVPVSMGWNDIGSWQALWEIGNQDPAGNVVQGQGQALLEETTGSFFMTENPTQPHKWIAAIGVSDLIVIDTEDVLLLVRKDLEQHVRHLADKIQQCKAAGTHPSHLPRLQIPGQADIIHT